MVILDRATGTMVEYSSSPQFALKAVKWLSSPPASKALEIEKFHNQDFDALANKFASDKICKGLQEGRVPVAAPRSFTALIKSLERLDGLKLQPKPLPSARKKRIAKRFAKDKAEDGHGAGGLPLQASESLSDSCSDTGLELQMPCSID